jgi:hypothetical protein
MLPGGGAYRAGKGMGSHVSGDAWEMECMPTLCRENRHVSTRPTFHTLITHTTSAPGEKRGLKKGKFGWRPGRARCRRNGSLLPGLFLLRFAFRTAAEATWRVRIGKKGDLGAAPRARAVAGGGISPDGGTQRSSPSRPHFSLVYVTDLTFANGSSSSC